MKATLLYLFFFNLAISASGQERVRFDAGKQPYFLVDTFTVDFKYLIISPDKVENVNVLKDSNAIALYGDKAKYGAVIMKTKLNANLLRIDDILTKYRVSEANRALRVCINNIVIDKPELIVIEASEIVEVEISTDRFWINPEDAYSKEKFINIKVITRQKNDL
jgi:hypothetical protein